MILTPSKHTPVLACALSQEDYLIEGLLAGDQYNFQMLYKMYAKTLLGVILRIVKSEEAAEDVLQETFVKIWQAISQYEKNKGRLFTWMIKVARNTAIDQVRSKGYVNSERNTSLDQLPSQFENQNALLFNPDTIGVKKLTERLKVAEKEVLDLIYFNGYTHAEVAEELGIPIGTVKTRLRSAISVLRTYFSMRHLLVN